MLRYAVFWFVFKVLGLLPLPAIYAVADVMAWAGYRLAGGSRANVLSNMRHVMPLGTPEREIKRAAKQVFRSVAYYYADTARLPRTDPTEFLAKRLTLHGLQENLVPAIEVGRGVVMLTGHFGNPELTMQALVPLGIHAFALTEPLEPPALSRLIDRQRTSHGLTYEPVSVGSVKRVMQTLRKGGVVALTGDRDIQGPKQRLPFCGAETMMPTGPIEVALRSGAAVVPCFSVRNGRYKIVGYIEEPLELEKTGDLQEDVRRGELKWLERFERHLRADPGQWAVLETIWDLGATAESISLDELTQQQNANRQG